jgi:hypothetical protein
MSIEISSIRVSGYRSIRDMQAMSLDRLTLLESGTSNVDAGDLLRVFRLLSFLFKYEHGLAEYASSHDGAERLFSDQPPTTKSQITIDLAITTRPEPIGGDSPVGRTATYFVELVPDAAGGLRIKREGLRVDRKEKEYKYGYGGSGSWFVDCGRAEGLPMTDWVGHIPQPGFSEPFPLAVAMVAPVLQSLEVVDFSDATPGSALRRPSEVVDGAYLHPDGSNQAAVLYAMRTHDRRRFDDISAAITSVAPEFREFVLEPVKGVVSLRWLEAAGDSQPGPAVSVGDRMVAARDAPGGFLRLVAWVTLLMQSADVLPPVVVLDRPDSDIPRGAVGLVHRLMSKVSDQGTQVIASLAGSASPVA